MKNIKNKSRFANKRSGQIVIITLLMLATFTVIGASVVTQMVFEQRKAVLEEKTQQSYYAAESGIEEALKRIQQGQSATTEFALGGANVKVDSTTAGGGEAFNIGLILNSGEVFYLDLTDYTGSSLRVCWDKADVSALLTLFYVSGTATKIYTYTVNTSASQNPKIQGGATAVAGASCGMSGGYYYDLGLPAATSYNYLVVRPLYQDAVKVAFNAATGAILPNQGETISSQGSVADFDSQVVRRVRLFQSGRKYTPFYFLQPFYGAGGVSYGPGKNWE